MYLESVVIFLFIFGFSEILIEERHQQKETLRRENRRVHIMSWGECIIKVYIVFI